MTTPEAGIGGASRRSLGVGCVTVHEPRSPTTPFEGLWIFELDVIDDAERVGPSFARCGGAIC